MAHEIDVWYTWKEFEMRSYRIIEESGKYRLHLYEAGFEEPRAVLFESRDRAYEAAIHYVTEYDGYLPFDDE